jgi:hypothetical protein
MRYTTPPPLRHARISACTCGNLVYLSTLKCGHSFFSTNLRENYKWAPIEFSNINWASQHVFSHMLSPLERRHKGIAEYLLMTNTADLWYTNPKFRAFINDTPVLDEHSMSYHDTYGNYAWMIDWIPLNNTHQHSIEMTNMLLSTHGIKLTKWDMNLTHNSTADKKKLTKDLEVGWNQQTNHSLYTQMYLERDTILYQQVIEKFDSFGEIWSQVSWLRDRAVTY